MLGSSTSLSWRLKELPRSRYIGLVGGWMLGPFQTSRSGGVGEAILYTSSPFEVPRGVRHGVTFCDGHAGDLIVGSLGPPKAFSGAKGLSTKCSR